jgi:hypothetical protein
VDPHFALTSDCALRRSMALTRLHGPEFGDKANRSARLWIWLSRFESLSPGSHAARGSGLAYGNKILSGQVSGGTEPTAHKRVPSLSPLALM